MDVSDRRMQVQLTQEARIASDFLYIRAILAVVGFVSVLSAREQSLALISTFVVRLFYTPMAISPYSSEITPRIYSRLYIQRFARLDQ